MKQLLVAASNETSMQKAKRRLWICVSIGLACCVTLFVTTMPYAIHEISASDLTKLARFQALQNDHQVSIADQKEVGQRLVLCLTFVDADQLQPLTNQAVLLYHTSAAGEYEPEDPNDETSARLSGHGITDSEGRLIVWTILPGDYGSSSDNRHIHLAVRSATPEFYDIHFKQYSTFMLRRFVNQSDQHFLADVKRGADGELIAFVSIECKLSS